jgi:hypothetical protein
MTVLITMFQGDIVPVAPPPGPSVQPNTLLSKGPSIRAPREPLGILDGSSNGTPISNKDGLSDDSEVLDSLQLPFLGTAAHVCEDPEAHDTALPRQSAGLSPGDVEDLWLQEMIHLDNLKMCAEFIRCL